VAPVDSAAVTAPAQPDPAWLEELFEWLRIPSISADSTHADDVRRAGEWVCDFVRSAGGSAELVETKTLPLAVGEIAASNGAGSAPTVLLYGHFDVQPPPPLELWKSEPFEPEIRDGYIYARGAADDKGNAYLLLKAAALLAGDGTLPVNVRVAFDGEEETGGSSIVEFIEQDERGADACLIFDGDMPREDQPAFVLGVRGNLYYHLRVKTGERDLHSGVFGGAALNAAHALIRALEPALSIPDELRAGVVAPTEEERRSWAALDSGEDVLAQAGARRMDPAAAEEFYERTMANTAIDVHGIAVGEPYLQKTVLPVSAEANVSIRLAAGQNRDQIDEAFQRLIREALPEGADLEIERWGAAPPGLIPPDSAAIVLAQDAFERVVGRRPLLLRSGGTLPIVPALADKRIPTILSGFALPNANMHSPNECLLARYVPLGVATAQETLVAFKDL
jgi:acetylornithine deacetylase/succinyl-diaminopimelate desuccinylase-like protein